MLFTIKCKIEQCSLELEYINLIKKNKDGFEINFNGRVYKFDVWDFNSPEECMNCLNSLIKAWTRLKKIDFATKKRKNIRGKKNG